ncbi:hypothetical protein [Alicyclobacillus sp. SO9]|uniref:hypothetical protein n=1 Tax=Alicyclobacillus sp. SO9 TaxID=2665646 RepID=UPI0018E7FD31|nr:hypothetical protein [Alicyclobacillus sp. SO9]QQE80089.1 hypothetical protein GI364_06400 [Alicyclobacillus sp. SO9]
MRWVISGAVAVIVGFLTYQFYMSNVVFALIIALNSLVLAAWFPLKSHGRIRWVSIFYPFVMGWLANIMFTSLHITGVIPGAVLDVVAFTGWSSVILTMRFMKQ